MKLIAQVTIVAEKNGKPVEIPPGGEFDIKEKDEAESLVARGFAVKPEKAAKPEKADGGGAGGAGADGNDGNDGGAGSDGADGGQK